MFIHVSPVSEPPILLPTTYFVSPSFSVLPTPYYILQAYPQQSLPILQVPPYSGSPHSPSLAFSKSPSPPRSDPAKGKQELTIASPPPIDLDRIEKLIPLPMNIRRGKGIGRDVHHLIPVIAGISGP